MATQRRKLTGNLRAEAQGPLGHLIQGAIDKRHLGYPRTAKLLNAAIKQDTGQTASITHSSLRNWISRWVIPQPDSQRALLAVLDIPERTLAQAIEAQQAARAELRMRRSSYLPGPARTQNVAMVTPSATPEQSVPSDDGLVSTMGTVEGDLSDEEVISIPVKTANGVIGYVITRRAFVSSTLAAAAPTLRESDQEGTEDIIDVLDRIQKLSRAVNPEIVRHLQDSMRRTLARYETLDHPSLVPALLKQRAWIDASLDECSHPMQRQQLFAIAGATSGVLGYVAVGRGEFPLARAYCLEAFQLGDFAQDANLQAWARGLQSFCEYYAGQYEEALRFAQDGLKYAQSGPQSVRLTINGTARAMGKLGDAEGVHRAVHEAYELMSCNDVPSGVPSSIALECYSAAQTASNAATAYVSLGLPKEVQHYVDLALPDISKSESAWSRSLVMIDLALSLVRPKEADLDRASELVLEALSISAGRPIISIQQRASEFVRDATDRWGNVRQISEVRDAASTLKGVDE